MSVLVALLCHQVDSTLLQPCNLGLWVGIAAVRSSLISCRLKYDVTLLALLYAVDAGAAEVEYMCWRWDVTKQQHAAYHHQEGEDKPISVTDEKGKKLVHVPDSFQLSDEEWKFW